MSEIIMDVHREWMSRPADERITGATSAEARSNMEQQAKSYAEASRGLVVSTRDLKVLPTGEGLGLVGQSGHPAIPTHWALGQLAARAGAPAGYLRSLPPALAAECLNHGLRAREVEEVGVLLRRSGGLVRLGAVTGPAYGRIWNYEVVNAVNRHLDSKWVVPGIRGQALSSVTSKNTTLFLSDRDMFLFLADEERRIEIPNRRNGQAGSLARGVMISNSEVGSARLRMVFMLYDYLCANRIVWGVEHIEEVAIRHSKGAPGRFMYRATPQIRRFMDARTDDATSRIEEARQHKLPDAAAFLQARAKLTAPASKAVIELHLREEGRPVETRWDAVVGLTAYARDRQWQDERFALEEAAGRLWQ